MLGDKVNMSKKTDSILKGLFVQALEQNTGNITEACKAINVHRTTYYNWYKKFPQFAKQCDAVKEGLIDIAESQLHKNVADGNQKAIEFTLINLKKQIYSNRDLLPVIGTLKVEITKTYKGDKPDDTVTTPLDKPIKVDEMKEDIKE